MKEGISQYIGIVLISIIVFFFVNNNFKADPETIDPANVTAVDSNEVTETVIVEETIETVVIDPNDTVALLAQELAQQSKYGSFYKNLEGSEKEIIIENDLIQLTLNSKGAQVKKVELKEFKTFDGKPLFLIDNTQEVSYNFEIENNIDIASKDVYFDVVENEKGVSFQAKLSNGKIFEIVYSLNDNSYFVDYQVNFNGIPAEEEVLIDWNFTALKQERDLASEETKSSAYWKVNDGKVDHLGIGSSKEEIIEENTNWLSYKQRFFNITLLNDKTFDAIDLETKIDNKDTSNVAIFTSTITTDDANHNFQFYFGPNDYKLLKDYGNDMHNLVELSADFFIFRWVKWINAWLIIPLFNFLENYISSYGIIILIMTLIIKMILMPLTFKSYVSTAKTKVLKPELEALKESFGDDTQGYSKAQMELYSKAGVSMFGGCLPMLLQMPFLLAMFYFFPSSIELRQEAFLWAQDLSSFDTVPFLTWAANIPILGHHLSVFTLLMTASSILMAKFNPQMQSQPTQKGMEMMKYMPYIFPFFLLFLFNNFPAALTYYYFLSNMITFGQQVVINKFFIDEDKLKAQIEENKKKPLKKSKLAKKMEEVYKQQEQQKKNKK